MKQQVYIFGCEGATILLEGKAKNIVLDSFKKTKLVFDNAVSSIEIVNYKGVQVQCKGVFVTSKSSEMNVAFPQGAGSDDYVEKPIPEQFVHKDHGRPGHLVQRVGLVFTLNSLQEDCNQYMQISFGYG
ncbi:hypothetical protein PC117_g8486 [Phytophthora cactorum]|uniref:C-CAP/cofactor C-like domain-containing protein n=1 Tax=Phytophthora cactorum TaxID=29920 RepID=A0A8T1DXS6_9STRA|nr:hypothetical protein PC117_g8486 [Phytophthora cactorum]